MTKLAEREISYQNGALTLAGIVLRPRAESRIGAVFVHGSGYSDRTNPWYQEIAKYLAKHGVIVLLPDKRGCYESEGDWRKANFHDLAGDALAGAGALRAQVPLESIGLIGVSQGGWIAPLAAHMGSVAFVVSLSGATITPSEQFHHEVTQDIRRTGLPSALSSLYYPIAQMLLKRRWPRWTEIQHFDPIPLWETLQVPGLLVFGDEDEYDNVPVQKSVQRITKASRSSPQLNLTVKVFHGSGHGLRQPKTRCIRPDFLRFLTDWITAIST